MRFRFGQSDAHRSGFAYRSRNPEQYRSLLRSSWRAKQGHGRRSSFPRRHSRQQNVHTDKGVDPFVVIRPMEQVHLICSEVKAAFLSDFVRRFVNNVTDCEFLGRQAVIETVLLAARAKQERRKHEHWQRSFVHEISSFLLFTIKEQYPMLSQNGE